VNKAALYAAMTLLTVSLGACTWLAKTRAEAARPIDVPGVGPSAMDRAAAAAAGQRVLVIVTKPGVAATGRIYQSARGAEGWMPYDATPDAANPLVPVLDALAAAAAADFAPDQALNADVVRALQVFGVAIVVASDGSSIVTPVAGESDPNVATSPEVPALRLRHTNPVFLLLAESGAHDPADPVGFVRSMRYGDAQFQDDEYSQWGGAVTIDAAQAGEFLFAWPASGARVTLDGAAAETRAAGLPMLVVKVPAGKHRVEVAYGEPQKARDVIAIAAAVGAVVAFVALWLGLRPHPERSVET
jgi:hypothetical protein